jgi:uncharacterized RDD family membrane protein YckC
VTVDDRDRDRPAHEDVPTDAGVPVEVVPKEARTFQGHRAGIVTRVLANVVDFAVAAGTVLGGYLFWLALRFLVNPTGFHFGAPQMLFLLLAVGAVLWLLYTMSWASTGRTPGDHLFGLRVVNFQGGRVRWVGAGLRAAFCVVVPIGLFWVVISRQNRSLQDTVLRTSVIYDWTTRAQPARPRPVSPVAPLEGVPPVTARLPQPRGPAGGS